jgi:YfiR/HmsC-like
MHRIIVVAPVLAFICACVQARVPDLTDLPFTIAVAGAEPIAAELAKAVSGRTINERPVAVRRVRPGDSLSGVQILFIGRPENARLAMWAQSAQQHSTLIVTEWDGALAQGSMINFMMSDQRVRFEVALDAAEKSKLKLSSRLLAVALQIRTGTP